MNNVQKDILAYVDWVKEHWNDGVNPGELKEALDRDDFELRDGLLKLLTAGILTESADRGLRRPSPLSIRHEFKPLTGYDQNEGY